jgi:hypothetical protein
MLVVYNGKSKCLMTDYNGKRICFEKGKPVEIPKEVYSFMLQSRHVEVDDLSPVEVSVPVEKPVEIVPEEKEEPRRGPGRPRK